MGRIRIEPGRDHPLGPTLLPDGVHLAVHAPHAAFVEVVLFEDADAEAPSHVFRLEAQGHRRGSRWHAFLRGAGAEQVYGYRLGDGRLLLDPYARSVVVPARYDREAAAGDGDTTGTAMRSAVTPREVYDWEDDHPPQRAWSDTVIYEMHVAGFTKHASSGVAPGLGGTYRGVIEKIPYLVDLGVTAVELLPVFAFDAQDAPEGLTNYWGYTPVSYFAPHPAYAAAARSGDTRPSAVLDEFRDMVKALHRAGLEVLLDVVYNHTSEYDESGPTFCFRAFDNPAYYLLDPETGANLDYTGCGNTVRANHPVTQRLILDSLRYWVEEMHVDGFRFDLASAFARDEGGTVLEAPPVVLQIDTDPVLAPAKLIAEPWDAAGLHQVGRFPGQRWAEWDGVFRDAVRRFLCGEDGTAEAMTQHLVGSPEKSVQFVTCHDGFTLNDLFSYEKKHNEANRTDVDSGTDDNLSCHQGVEGPTDDPTIEGLRGRQVKNALAVTLLSQATPMLLMGDEVRRTQRGNNNAYCQDNDLSWFDWQLLDSHADVHRFAQRVIRVRLGLPVLRAAPPRWHGVQSDSPDLGDTSHSLACELGHEGSEARLYLILNAWTEALEFELPRLEEGAWLRVLDTALPSPQDVCEPGAAVTHASSTYHAEARSVVLLAGGLHPKEIP